MDNGGNKRKVNKIKIILGVILVLNLIWLMNITYDHAVSQKAWYFSITITFAWLFVYAIILKYDTNFLRKLLIGGSLVFFYILIMNRLLLSNISYIQPLVMIIALSSERMYKNWGKNRSVKNLVGFLCIFIVYLPLLFFVFDEQVTIAGQMEDDVEDYINESERFDEDKIESIEVVYHSMTDTFAIVMFKTEPKHEYIFVDNGSDVDFIKKRTKRNYE